MTSHLVVLFFNKFGVVSAVNLFPGDATLTRKDHGDAVLSRKDHGDAVVSRTGPGGATVSRKQI